jgi:hypothetical protein
MIARSRFGVFLSLALACAQTCSASDTPAPHPPSDNAELQKIFGADQADRLGDAFRKEPEAVLARDAHRRDAALKMVKDGALHTARDYFSAAMVFQHSAEDIGLAHALATIASYMDPQNKQYRWLIAASWDRMLMQHVQPQWYGTQYQSDAQGTFLFPVAEGAVTDAERADMGVPPLEESRARLAEMAAMVGEKPHPKPPTLEDLQKNGRLDFGKTPPPAGSGKTEK